MNAHIIPCCVLGIAVLFVLGMGAGAAPTRDATEDGPKDTVRAIWLGVKADDVDAVKRCMVLGKDVDEKYLDLAAELLVVPHRFAKLCKTKFGKAHAGIPGYSTDEAIDAALVRLDRLGDDVVKIDGDTATLKVPERPAPQQPEDAGAEYDAYANARAPFEGGELSFKRIDGEWKLHMGNDEGWEGPEEGTWIPAMRLSMTMLKDVMAEIETGKLKTLGEVETTLRTRYADAIKELEKQMA